MKVYPCRYSCHAALIEQLMTEPTMLLIDTRFSPHSRWSLWERDALEARYGRRYRWAGQFLGNVLYKQKGAPIQLVNPTREIERLIELLNQDVTLLMLCGCRTLATCHLTVIVELLCQHAPAIQVVYPETLGAIQTQATLMPGKEKLDDKPTEDGIEDVVEVGQHE